MVITGQVVVDTFTIRFSAHREANSDSVSVETRDNYNSVLQYEALNPDPWSVIRDAVARATNELKARTPSRPARPPLQRRVVIEEPRGPSRLGPRRSATQGAN